ncbi:hypothetical protein [Actinomycetospora termitidis]|uniref:Uncharacterized protein n=1 Tax=Actinomycetospora termitidis TaxID=3053470 RepID=A0ABT7MFL9_9PSEU|nr:hypothetical protein [Actinomycetospora sp. Odt1-22]MDL5159473.1 hypothetical protein [Actinomycetospora sp. Odt1-22]
MTIPADLTLAKGGHDDPQDGLCLLEAVAYVAGLPHSDHPACTSIVLGTFGRSLNDVLPDDLRQELRPLIPQLIGTAGDGLDERRSLMALDWLIRTYLPAWLQLAHLDEQARAVRELAQIVDLETAQAAGPVVRAAREKSAAAWDAAGAAARDAAGAAAWDAAGVAAGAAAGAAAGDAAGDAARDAAGDAARDAAGDAAWDAAWAAAWAAAGDAAWDVLAPTVTELQRSAIDLYRRMATIGKDGQA